MKNKKSILLAVLVIAVTAIGITDHFYPFRPEKVIRESYQIVLDEILDNRQYHDYTSGVEEKFRRMTKGCYSRCGGEIDALAYYLDAQNVMYLFGEPMPWTYEDQWEYLKKIPADYDGYLSEEILPLRQLTEQRVQIREEAMAKAPRCRRDGCTGKAMVGYTDENLKVQTYYYCKVHNCNTEGCMNPKITKYYCREHAPSGAFCRANGCEEPVDPDKKGAKYCKRHECSAPDCTEPRGADGSVYCQKHSPGSTNHGSQGGANRGSQGSGNRESQGSGNHGSPGSGNSSSGAGAGRSSSGSSCRTDPYDAEAFDDPDDFADEWAEEFGDGNFEDGWDDAWDYWQEEHE